MADPDPATGVSWCPAAALQHHHPQHVLTDEGLLMLLSLICAMQLCRLLQLPGPHYVLFMADPDPATGVSWCPDCVRCGPAVKGVMAEKKASLLEVLVGQRPVWKDPQHPLR